MSNWTELCMKIKLGQHPSSNMGFGAPILLIWVNLITTEPCSPPWNHGLWEIIPFYCRKIHSPFMAELFILIQVSEVFSDLPRLMGWWSQIDDGMMSFGCWDGWQHCLAIDSVCPILSRTGTTFITFPWPTATRCCRLRYTWGSFRKASAWCSQIMRLDHPPWHFPYGMVGLGPPINQFLWKFGCRRGHSIL